MLFGAILLTVGVVGALFVASRYVSAREPKRSSDGGDGGVLWAGDSGSGDSGGGCDAGGDGGGCGGGD